MTSSSLRGSKRWTIFLFLILLFDSVALGKVFEVPTANYPTLSSALEEALSNDEEDIIYLVDNICENVLISLKSGSEVITIEGKGGVFDISGDGKGRCLSVLVEGGSLRLVLSKIRLTHGLSGEKGGAFFCEVLLGARLSLEAYDLWVESSTASSHGGGVAFVNYGLTELSFKRAILRGNRSERIGGAVFLDGCYALFENSLVVENRADYGGGGLYIANSSHVVLGSSTVANNVARYDVYKKDGGGIYISGSSTLELKNSIVWGNEGSASSKDIYLSSNSSIQCRYSLLEGFSGEGCIGGNPLFNQDYSLSSLSPCVDAGDPESFPRDDLYGNLRPADGNNDGRALPDIGAIEAQLDITPPAELSNVEALTSTHSVYLLWLNPSDLDFSFVRIYLNSQGSWEKIVEIFSEEFLVQGLLADTEYSFKLSAVDIFGNESEGVVISVKTLEETPTNPDPMPQPDTTPPQDVLNLSASPSTFSVTLLWDNPQDPDLKGCRVYRESLFLGSLEVSPSSSSFYEVKGLEPDTLYSFKVTTLDRSGNESSGKSITVKTLPHNNPPVIERLGVIPSIGSKGTLFKIFSVAKDSDGDSLSYSWELSDESAGLFMPYESEAYLVAYALPEPVSVHVRLRVTDSKGGFDERSVSLKIDAWREEDSDGDGVEDSVEGDWRSNPKVAFFYESGIMLKVDQGKLRNLSLKGENPYDLFLEVIDLNPGDRVELEFLFPNLIDISLYAWERGDSFKALPFVGASLILKDGVDPDLDGEANGRVGVFLRFSGKPVELKGGCELSQSSTLLGLGNVLIIFGAVIHLLRRVL